MVHCFNAMEQNIVVDVYSGAVHIMETPAFEMVKYYEEFGFHNDGISEDILAKLNSFKKEELYESYNEIKELVKSGLLFFEDCYLEVAQSHKKQSVVKALCLHIAHDCNLRCIYCFADEGAFGGRRGLMSYEVGKAAIDFVTLNSGNRKNIEIDYFGGEPLVNFEVVKGITEYAKAIGAKNGKNFRFTITTNGILLDDDKIDYINKNMSNVVLSIDGTKETNDKMRKRPDGGGSYDNIVPKFKKIAESRAQDNYYVRGTFTRENLDFAKDVFHLADLGFKQTSVEPVVAPFDTDYALQYEDLDKIYKEYDLLAEEYVKRKLEGNGFNFFHFMVDLEQGPCIIKRLSGCGSGSEYLAITPEGDIYPCHQFVGQVEFLMGNVLSGQFDWGVRDEFDAINVYSKDDCKKCWAKFYCSGGCNANAWNFNKDLKKPYHLGCELQRKRTECAIAIKAKLSL